MTVSLRELLTAATPGPWALSDWQKDLDLEAYAIEGPGGVGVAGGTYDGGGVWNLADAALVVSLRNQAEALLDVVEAAQAYREAADKINNAESWGDHVWREWVQQGREAWDALRAALSRLAATEPQAEQQPEQGGLGSAESRSRPGEG